VAINAAEEETIEALKKWWEENGKQLMLAVVVIVGGYGGWTFWQNSQIAQSNAASDLYEEILVLVNTDPAATVNGANAQPIIDLAMELRQEHGTTSYSRFAALFAAQQQVLGSDLEAAEESLRWILDNPREGLLVSPDIGLQLTTTLRLGRVLLAKGDNEAALVVATSIAPEDFEAGFAELQGDIYLALGRTLEARESYQAAQQVGSSSDGLRMKLDNLADDS
jgi:predicted negative regulator of RcsB-dependent stress response